MKIHDFCKLYELSDNIYALYNYAYDKVLYFTLDLKDILDHYLRAQTTDGLDELHPDFFQALKDNLFLVESEVDNFNFVSRRVSSLLQSESQYILTINPTLDCNLRCWYCYQKHTKDHFMSKPLIDTVVKFAENIVKKKKVESFVLSFFGGEPLLLANDIALPIAKSISNKCELFKKKFKLHFTTNGTLLTSDILAQIKLISNHVSFQIPFDGNREIHNKIKRSKDIDDTYSLTIKNILDALKFGFHVTIRCNYDESNILSFIDLINDIKAVCGDFMDLINFDFQKIWQAKRTLKLSEDLIAVKRHLTGKDNYDEIFRAELPKSFCYADYKNSIVINYDGNIYKCTARDFSQENSIGTINYDKGLIITDKKYSYNNRILPACKTCRIYPICTVCIENRLDAKAIKNRCPILITESDIDLQINHRFEALFGKTIVKECN